ncbi:MAG: hypothetical protein DVB23_000644 [Verrucomicrobia bacterium]|nr:MAG: hypothetical protein DVB23_000644 [Verrucomicrobiota bacterium]
MLLKRLDPVFDAQAAVRRRWAGLAAMTVALLCGFLLWAWLRGQDAPPAGTGIAWLLASVFLIWSARRIAGRWPFDLGAMARRIEGRFPDLKGRLLTALELPEPSRSKPQGYLEERLLLETLTHSTEHDWTVVTRGRHDWRWPLLQGAFWLVLCSLGVHLQSIDSPVRSALGAPSGRASVVPVEVTPGNIEIEKGAKLVVEARFTESVPEEATLELLEAESDKPVGRSFEMRRALDDPVFAAVVPAVDKPVRYRVVHQNGASESYEVKVYELPRLERADVTVTPPAYAGQKPETFRDVRKVSALEGSGLLFALTVNHPVAAAELYGEDGKSIPLAVDPDNPRLLTASVRPEADRRYRVHLVDAADRANADPPWLTVKLRRNEPPKLELALPGRDTEVSALEEVMLQGKVWDDLGLGQVGATVTVGDRTETILLAQAGLKPRETHQLSTLLALEQFEAKPQQLVSYHLWAEDVGPDGKMRRTQSDLFFAEIRDWDHAFREGVQQGESSGKGAGNQAGELRQQQKEVLNATWKLIREAGSGGIESRLADVQVVREGQDRVAKKVAAVLAEVEDSQVREALDSAREKMEQAAAALGEVPGQGESALARAQGLERAAYQDLLAAEARETQVTQSKSRSSGESGGSQQRQLMQLELKENENRYESERQAEKEESTAQEENLEVLARLKELARRQEALAGKIQELEAALKAAREEAERGELERRLERLRAEQEEMLRDVDELLERMESEENSERMGPESRELRTAREEVREAGEQLQRQELSQAANSARRAQENLREMQEEFREKAGQRFAEELRELRQQARTLAEREEKLGEQLDKAPARALGEEGPDRQQLATGLGEQKEALEKFLEQMRQISEQAEESEPVLSNSMYEAVRDAREESPVESLEQAARFSRYGAMAEAQEEERAAARAIDRLQKGVEEAAGSLLGSESDALRTARKELDGLIDAVESEMAGAREPAKGKGGGEESAPDKPFFEALPENPEPGPLAGQGYESFADGLRRLEQMLTTPELQAEAADLLDRARVWRREFRERDATAPQWDLVKMQLLQPLVELRQDVSEALSRVEKDNPLVPVDRDPVPGPFRDLVREYYERLAAGR